jgi:hypothetical protein
MPSGLIWTNFLSVAREWTPFWVSLYFPILYFVKLLPPLFIQFIYPPNYLLFSEKINFKF